MELPNCRAHYVDGDSAPSHRSSAMLHLISGKDTPHPVFHGMTLRSSSSNKTAEARPRRPIVTMPTNMSRPAATPRNSRSDSRCRSWRRRIRPRCRTMKATASAMRRPAKIIGSAPKRHDAREDRLARAGAVILRDVPVDFLDIGGARIGVDDDRKEDAGRDERDLRGIAEAESEHQQRHQAIFGIGNSMAIRGSKKIRTGRNIAMRRPTATAGAAPMTKPATTRQSVAATCNSSSPVSMK